MLALAALALRLFAFQHIAGWLGRLQGAAAIVPLADAAAQRRAARWRTAIAFAARAAPFRADCLPQALVAVAFCRMFGVPYALHLGFSRAQPARQGAAIALHAWAVSGRVTLSGGAGSFGRYTVIACYAPGDLLPPPG